VKIRITHESKRRFKMAHFNKAVKQFNNLTMKQFSNLAIWAFLLALLGLGLVSPPPLGAKEFGVAEDLYVGRHTTTPFGGIGRWENLLKWSEAFDNAAWTKNDVTITPNNQTAPDGQTTADTATKGTVAATDNLFQYPGAQLAASTAKDYTISVWLKAAAPVSGVTLKMYLQGVNTYTSSAFTVGTTWERYTYTANLNNTSLSAVNVGGGISIPNSATLYVWGAQLEQASEAGVYVQTTASAVSLGRGIVSNEDYRIVGDQIISGNTTITGNLTVSGTATLQNTTYIGASAGAEKDLYISRYLYDWDNTGYYIDPAGTSKFNSVYLASNLKNWSGYDLIQGGSVTDWLRINPSTNFSRIAFYGYGAFGTGGLYVGSWSDAGAGNIHATNIIYADASIRAPIFYDKDNTAFYLDPSAVDGAVALQLNNGNIAGVNEVVMNDTGEGIRWAGGNAYIFERQVAPLGLELGDAEGVFFTAGKVGIGTTAPARELEVNGAIMPKNLLLFKSGTTNYIASESTSDAIYFGLGTPGSGSYPMMIAGTSGNIGIGTTAPKGQLHVRTATTAPDYDNQGPLIAEHPEARIQIIADDGGSNAAALIISDADKHWAIHHRPSTVAGGAANRLDFQYGTTAGDTDMLGAVSTKMSIDTSGSVGIGTTSPEAKLDVSGTLLASAGTPLLPTTCISPMPPQLPA
jgi:hypothetical protein